MKNKDTEKQYTIRGVPLPIDRALRQMAKEDSMSLNQLLLNILSKVTASAVKQDRVIYTDLDFLIGSWKEDPEFDAAIESQSQVDPELWK